MWAYWEVDGRRVWPLETDGRVGGLDVVQRPGAGWSSERAHACQARYHGTPCPYTTRVTSFYKTLSCPCAFCDLAVGF